MKINQAITVIAALTTLFAIISGFIGLLMLGVSLHYHPRPQSESLMWLGVLISASGLPVLFVWLLKFQFIKSLWAKYVLTLTLLIFGGLLSLFFLWGVITDSGDFIIWFPLFLYGALIMSSACLFLKRDASSLT